jgi:hypothetical protein
VLAQPQRVLALLLAMGRPALLLAPVLVSLAL